MRELTSTGQMALGALLEGNTEGAHAIVRGAYAEDVMHLMTAAAALVCTCCEALATGKVVMVKDRWRSEPPVPPARATHEGDGEYITGPDGVRYGPFVPFGPGTVIGLSAQRGELDAASNPAAFKALDAAVRASVDAAGGLPADPTGVDCPERYEGTDGDGEEPGE